MLLIVCSLRNVEAAAAPGKVSLSASVAKDTVILKWNKVSGADGYQVYQYQESIKKYQRIKVLSATSLTLKGKLNQTYLFRVRAYKRDSDGVLCGPLTTPLTVKTAPSKVVITYAKSDAAKSATLKWNKVESADGYQVFRQNLTTGKYVRIKTIADHNTVTYKDEGLSTKFSCKYKVRAYRKNNDTVIYGSSSSAAEVKYRSILFVGDSRTVMMQSEVDSGLTKWICKSGEGYSWLKNTAAPKIEANIYNVNKVVIWLGVNDVYNINNYISFINQKAAQWAKKGVTTYVCAVGQVENDPYVTNAEIRQFNLKLMAELKGIKYINLYTYLKNTGYDTTDGTHYTSAVTKRIYRYIINALY